VVHLSVGRSRPFEVHALSVKQTDLKSWNVAALNPKSGLRGTKSLDATSLSLQFESAAQVDEFEKWVLFLRADRLGMDRESAAFRISRQSRTLDRTPARSSLSLPSPLSPGPRGTMSFESLPQIPRIHPIEEDFWRELDSERPTRELDGSPINQPFELGGRGC
jgi:hypothetical protein